MSTKEIRINVCNDINKIIKNSTMTKQIERSIYEFTKEYIESNDIGILAETMFDTIYNNKADEIICNLKTNYKYILDSIKSNKIKIDKIAFLKPSELNMDQYSEIIKRKQIEQMMLEPKGTNAYECKKCKKKRCNVVERQIRAGDEPATQFVTCLECGHVFSFTNIRSNRIKI